MKKLLLVGFVLVSTIAYSQVSKGDVSVTFNGSLVSTSDFSFGLFSAKGGYFFTDNLEAGVKPTLIIGEGFSSFGFGAYGTYNFLMPDGKLLPYAGAELSTRSMSFDGAGGSLNQTDLGLYGGAKYFLTESLNIDANMNYSFNVANNYGPGAEPGATFMMNFGVGFILGKLK